MSTLVETFKKRKTAKQAKHQPKRPAGVPQLNLGSSSALGSEQPPPKAPPTLINVLNTLSPAPSPRSSRANSAENQQEGTARQDGGEDGAASQPPGGSQSTVNLASLSSEPEVLQRLWDQAEWY